MRRGLYNFRNRLVEKLYNLKIVFAKHIHIIIYKYTAMIIGVTIKRCIYKFYKIITVEIQNDIFGLVTIVIVVNSKPY